MVILRGAKLERGPKSHEIILVLAITFKFHNGIIKAHGVLFTPGPTTALSLQYLAC